MKAPERIETARLILTRPSRSDAEAIFERYASDSEVTRFLNWPRHQSLSDALTFVEFSDTEWQQWPAGPYLIWLRVDGSLVGGTGLGFETPDRATTGYVFARDAWGQGYATESLQAMVELARRAGVVRLYALCHPQHRASWHVLEKCRFTRDDAWHGRAEFPNLTPGVQSEVLRYVLTLDPVAP